MEVPVFEDGKRCGFLRAERQGLYTQFLGEVTTEAVCRMHALFEGGEAVLGVPVPENGRMVLKISVPTGRLPGGQLLRGELRKKQAGWNHFPGGRRGNVVLPPGRCQKGRFQFPWKPGEKLPCEELMCFFRYDPEGYLELLLDENGVPQV